MTRPLPTQKTRAVTIRTRHPDHECSNPTGDPNYICHTDPDSPRYRLAMGYRNTPDTLWSEEWGKLVKVVSTLKDLESRGQICEPFETEMPFVGSPMALGTRVTVAFSPQETKVLREYCHLHHIGYTDLLKTLTMQRVDAHYDPPTAVFAGEGGTTTNPEYDGPTTSGTIGNDPDTPATYTHEASPT